VNVALHSILTMVRGVAADLGFAPSYTPGIPKGRR
jgi:5-methylthioadenosine/S-adenosylhomocysteine deaminase